MNDKENNPRTFRALRDCSSSDITLIERGDTFDAEKVQLKNVLSEVIEKERARQSNWKKTLRVYEITKPLKAKAQASHVDKE